MILSTQTTNFVIMFCINFAYFVNYFGIFRKLPVCGCGANGAAPPPPVRIRAAQLSGWLGAGATQPTFQR